MTMQPGPLAAPFISLQEGRVLKAYRDSVGVVTIGAGFTMGSKVFAGFAQRKWGRALRLGDTITTGECDLLLTQLLGLEYGPPVDKNIGTVVQHEYDGSLSLSFNLGTGATTWEWARLLKARKVPAAAEKVRTTGVTAKGKFLQGLANRRSAESRLIQFGDYGPHIKPAGASAKIEMPTLPPEIAPSVSNSTRDVKAYQESLKRLDYYSGPIDGIHDRTDPQDDTDRAVRRFQGDHPQLIADGIVGPATRAQLVRAEKASRVVPVASGSAPVAGGAAGATTSQVATPSVEPSSFPWEAILWGGLAFLVIGGAVVGYYLWRYPDEFKIGLRAWIKGL